MFKNMSRRDGNKSFGSYARSILKNSLITSIPEIALSRSWTKRGLKILVFTLCVIGFSYQTINFLRLYMAYPTVVNVHVSNPSQIVQPAVTFCNRNRRRLSVVCQEFPDRCFETDISAVEDFCHEFPRSCFKDNKGKYAMFMGNLGLSLKIETSFNWTKASQQAHTESMIQKCEKAIEGSDFKCEKPYLKVPVTSVQGETNFCYTIDSLWEKPDKEENIYANTFTFEFTLKTQPDEYLFYSEPILLQAAVHDRRKLVNPYFEGFSLRGGIHYEGYVSMVSKELLPAPYDTKCTNYLKMWKENNGTGPLNEMMCIEHCKLDKLKSMGACIDRHVVYPHTEQLCNLAIGTTTSEIINNCTLKCGSSCFDKFYEVRIDEVNSQEHLCEKRQMEWCKVSVIKLSLSFKKSQLTRYSYQPQFESVELYSYVGGYMGIWLGLSLVSLFDLFETVCYLIAFPMKRLRIKQEKHRIDPQKVKVNRQFDNPSAKTVFFDQLSVVDNKHHWY